ncbi:hypothetical protein BLOT_003971 [Blomia tropicalis]|nr:hypothetical protein BLOT_003971 [Blomia tropicalis]
MYVKFRRIFHRLSRKRLATILFENIPNIIIYCICFYYFFSFTIILIQRFLQYETTVLIRYESHYRAKFPAFTICGCCAHNIVCSVSSDQAIQHELATFERHSILDVLDNVSFPEHNLVLSCKFIYDSRRPEQWKPCTNSGNVIPSLHDGRKCLTYLSMLQEVRVETEENIQKTIDQSYGTTSYIQMEVNFSESRGLQLKQLLTALEDANQVTKLLEPPYNTNCRKYDPLKRPRSQNECINLCMIENSYYKNNGTCINYYNLATRPWLNHFSHLFDPTTIKFVQNPIHNTSKTRRQCRDQCNQMDCNVEIYNSVVEWSTINQSVDYNESNLSLVTMWPDMKQYEVVEHFKEINIFELIGCLGGHAHIFLGLSAIQLYDVIWSSLVKIKQLYFTIW